MQKAPLLESVFLNIKSFVQKSLSAREWDWQSTLLVIVLVQTASTRLAISEWVPDLGIIESISLYAVILGLLLGYTNFSRKISVWIAMEYALLMIPTSLLAIVDEAERTEFYSDDLQSLLLRLFDSIVLFFKNQPIYDHLFFILIASLGFWLISCYVGYRLIRHNRFLDSILGPGMIMLIVQIYDPWVPLRAWGLAFFIFISLTLLGRMHYLENKKGWKKKRVFLTSDTEWEFSRSVLYSAALAVIIAWALPGAISSVKPISKAWKDFTAPLTDRFSNAVTALDSPYGTSTSGDFYGSELMLGTHTPTSDTPVLFINIPKTELDIPRYYWRGRTYDTYQDGQWLNSNSQRKDFNPDLDEINLEESGTRTRVDLKVTVNFPKQELLYAPSEVSWFDRAGKLFVARMDNGNEEVLGMIANPGLTAGDSYKIRAMIATPTIQELRAAGTEYPAWVNERYMQVPDQLEPQLKDLAEEITASYINPFDKVEAITAYLRRTIKYQTSITEAPPSGEDPLLWILFDYQKGFCMYYASSEVLMLRTLRIPARMAVGFVEGTFDEDLNRYTVTPLDAHAWPEVYFPNIGWVEFEPTGNQPPLDRPQAASGQENTDVSTTAPNTGPLATIDEDVQNDAGSDPTPKEADQLPTSQNANQQMRLVTYTLSIASIVLAIILSKRYSVVNNFPIYWVKRYSKNGNAPPNWLAYWAEWAQLLPIEKNYQAINLSLRWLGGKQPFHNTASERAAALTKILPSAATDIQNLSAEYQGEVFASYPANLKLARRASFNILLKAWQARIFHYKEIIKRRYN